MGTVFFVHKSEFVSKYSVLIIFNSVPVFSLFFKLRFGPGMYNFQSKYLQYPLSEWDFFE